MQKSENPTFFIYYCTIKGDALGKLILNNEEIIFQPLNENFKGYLDQENDDFFNNTKLYANISYNQILNDPIIIPAPNQNSGSKKLDFFIQIEVSHTGYYKYTCNDTKKLINDFKKNNSPLASLYFKISSHDLFGEDINDKNKKLVAENLVNSIITNKNKAKINEITNTNIPYFDINYNLILEYITKSKINSIKEEEKIYYMQKNLIILEKLYGYKMMNKNLLDINNQSLISLDFIFPNTKNLKKYENEELFSKIILNKDKQEEKKNNNLMLGKINNIDLKINKNILNQESQILNNNQALLLDHFFPPYLKGTNWNLFYSKNIHGTSYNTLKRNSFHKGELVILITDENGYNFGGFSSQSLNNNLNFYGTRETFIFKIEEKDVFIFNATLNNDYFLFSDQDGFGYGSEDHFGLFIDKTLTKGSSHTCKTFNNPCLTKQNHFSIKKLEIWGFRNDSQNLF